jgi:hypothetical protein
MKDPRAAEHVALVPNDLRFKSFHVITPDGRGLSTGAAAIETALSLRKTRWVGCTLAKLRLAWLVGGLYRLLVLIKRFLGRFVADAPGPDSYP